VLRRWSELPDSHGGVRGAFSLRGGCCRKPNPRGWCWQLPSPEGVAGSDPALVGSTSCNLAPEDVASSDPALVDGASCNPAPEGVQVSSPSHTSMDIHVGSSPPRSDGATTMHASTASNKQVTLEVSKLDARSLVSVTGAELTPDNVLQIVPADIPPSSHDIAPPDLGFPLFLSNLQVSQLLAFYRSSR
jgi:hypothetical protein